MPFSRGAPGPSLWLLRWAHYPVQQRRLTSGASQATLQQEAGQNLLQGLRGHLGKHACSKFQIQKLRQSSVGCLGKPYLWKEGRILGLWELRSSGHLFGLREQESRGPCLDLCHEPTRHGFRVTLFEVVTLQTQPMADARITQPPLHAP